MVQAYTPRYRPLNLWIWLSAVIAEVVSNSNHLACLRNEYEEDREDEECAGPEFLVSLVFLVSLLRKRKGYYSLIGPDHVQYGRSAPERA
jgi:hypothetical protein